MSAKLPFKKWLEKAAKNNSQLQDLAWDLEMDSAFEPKSLGQLMDRIESTCGFAQGAQEVARVAWKRYQKYWVE